MYLPFYKIARTLALFAPSKYKYLIRQWGYDNKVKQNLKYINNNKKRVIKKLKKDIKKRRLNVVFYVYDHTKWKCQSLYELMEKSKDFKPCIFVTKNCAKKENFNFQTNNDLKKVFNFFKLKNMRVFLAYDTYKEKFIPFKNMPLKPDIIFYQHPWYVQESQGPVVCSKFALTCYVPYFIATSISQTEYCLRFHQYVQNHYVLNELVKNFYSKNTPNKGVNIKSVGHPMLDFFYLNKNKTFANENYVIYAPHWSVDNKNVLFWGTFLWCGQFILNYAKKHPEINWVFKPHPCLKGYLKNNNYLTKEEIEQYWQAWAKVGTICENGNYLDIFMQSKAMITDCGSFETEYLLTKKPLIHLKSAGAMPFNPSVEKIVQTYYNVQNIDELKETLDRVVIENIDDKKQERIEIIRKLNYENNFAAQNIIDDLLKTLL